MSENKLVLLSKCVERRFAEKLFYEGVLHFSIPSEWIKKAKEGSIGQGDLLEGVYTNENKFRNFFRRWFPRLVPDNENGVNYLRSRKIVNWPCYCLYSVSDQTEPVGREGDYVVYDMSVAYANDFNGNETWENRFDTAFEDRKAMVVINRPMAFLKKVRDFFEEKGLVEGRDYYMGCVQYRKDGEKFTYKEVPTELFHKDARFEPQQEFRIALNPESNMVKGLLDNQQNVDLKCSLDDCAMLKLHFYKGARILVKGDEVRLEVRDWSNVMGPLHEMELEPLLEIIGIPFQHWTCSFGEPGEVGAFRLWEEIEKVLASKYRIFFSHKIMLSDPRLPSMHFSWESKETIKENEVKDSYYYLRERPNHYKAPFFEGVFVPSPTGIQKYTSLSFKLDGPVAPLC